MSPFPSRFTLLIDGDNTSHELLTPLLRLLGPEVEGRVLCNPCSHSGWAGALKRNPSRLTLIRVRSTQKNAVDDQLMGLMREASGADPVLLVTRDADFSPCVDELDRNGTEVICLSTEPPAVKLRRACAAWVELLRSGEAHYHVRTRLLAAATAQPGPTEKRRGGRNGRGRRSDPDRRLEAVNRPDPDLLLRKVLEEEGVTPLPRLIALCVPLGGVEAHLMSRPDLYHLSGEGNLRRVSLMTPERAAYLALEATLRENGRMPLEQLVARARDRGLKTSHLPHRGFRKSLEVRPDRFRIVMEGDRTFAELIG